MTSLPTSSASNLDPTFEPFYEPPFQNATTAGTGWDKTLRRILHTEYAMPYTSYKEITSVYTEILQLFESSNYNPVGFYYRSDLKQMLSTVETFVQYSTECRQKGLLQSLEKMHFIQTKNSNYFWFAGPDSDADIRRQSKAMSTKIETEISLFRDQMGLEQRYKDFDNKRLLGFIAPVSMILAVISVAIFFCMTALAVALPWHWKFIISKAPFALAIGAAAYIGLDVSKRMQRYALAVQTLYMHYFLFIWGWNDLKACLVYVAELNTSRASDLEDARKFLFSFQSSFFGKEDELQLLQMRISASPAYSAEEELRFWQSIGSRGDFWKRKIA